MVAVKIPLAHLYLVNSRVSERFGALFRILIERGESRPPNLSVKGLAPRLPLNSQ